MPKKRTDSERDANLPDWADDVTPDEEVMRKFYAPTGVFRTGPIAVPDPPQTLAPQPAAVPPVAAPDANRIAHEGKPPTARESAAPPAPPTQRPQAPSPSTSLSAAAPLRAAREGGEAHPDPSDSAHTSPLRSLERPPTDLYAPRASVPRAHLPASSASFNSYASRWQGILYPGQLRLLRLLFEMTIDDPAHECSTKYGVLASAIGMSRRNCINIVNTLVEKNILERFPIVKEGAAVGVRLRLHLENIS